VQATFITKDGEKVAGRPPRLTYGNMRDGAVRLAAAAEVMGFAQGTETGLSAMAMSGMPVWVALGGGRMDDVALPDFVREIHIFADNDALGRDAAHRAADVHMRAGRQVKLRFPPDGINDFNDLLIAHADCDGDADRLMANLQAAGETTGGSVAA
jgi:putative DNA primase/helicase